MPGSQKATQAALGNLSRDLTGPQIRDLLTRVGGDALTPLARNTPGAEVKRIIDKYGDQTVRELAPLQGSGYQHLDRWDFIEFDQAHAAMIAAGRGQTVRDLPSLAGKDLTDIRAALGAAGMRDVTTPDAVDAAIALAEILVHAHERSWTLFSIRPETVFLTREAGRVRFSGIAPRCETFWASAQPSREAVPPAFTHFYFPPEILALKPPTPASDVFSLCATLAHWESDYPFAGKDIVSRIGSVLQDKRTAWTGPPFLQPIVDSGLASDPSHRPSASELVAALTRLR